MSFEKKKYQTIRQAISPELANFIYRYFSLQESSSKWLIENGKIPLKNPLIGFWDHPQVPGCYTKYGDWAMDTLLTQLHPLMQKITGYKLVPTYSFARIYNQGDILYRHSDRDSCEISCTLHLGGDAWPLWIDPTGEQSVMGGSASTTVVKKNAPKGICVNLKPGDLFIYSGCIMEHWRDAFEGKKCGQVFLHYNNVDGPFGKENLFDKRPMLGFDKAVLE